MKLRLIIFTLFCITSVCLGQKTIFHEYYNTASDVHIKKWNIDKNNLPDQFIKETIDNRNRVTELKFYKNNSLIYSHLCFLNVWIKYEYPNDTTITAYFLDYNGKENAEIECGIPSKTSYILSDDTKYILNSISEYNLDNKELYLKNGWSEIELENAIKELNSETNNISVIPYYSKSFSKLNKIYPVSTDYKMLDFQLSDKEKEEIKVYINKQ